MSEATKVQSAYGAEQIQVLEAEKEALRGEVAAKQQVGRPVCMRLWLDDWMGRRSDRTQPVCVRRGPTLLPSHSLLL